MNGHYGVIVFVISNTLSAMPFLILIAILSGTVCYFMVHFHPGFSHYFFFVLAIYASITAVESLMMVIASVVPNFLMGIIIGAGILVVNLICFRFIRLRTFAYVGMQNYNPYHCLHLNCVCFCVREYLCWSLGSSDSPMTYQNLSGVTRCLT